MPYAAALFFAMCPVSALSTNCSLSPLHLSFLPPPCLTLSLISRFLSHSLCIKRIGSQKETERERASCCWYCPVSLRRTSRKSEGEGFVCLLQYCPDQGCISQKLRKPKYIVDPLETQPRLVQNNCTSMFSFAILTMH